MSAGSVADARSPPNLTMTALTEGTPTLYHDAAIDLDIGNHHPDPEPG